MSDDNQLGLQGYNIVTILKRLEAATSRLEDITIFQDESKAPVSAANAPANAPGAAGASGADSAGVTPAAAEATPAAGSAAGSAAAPFVAAFDAFLTSLVQPFVAASRELDPLVGEAAAHFAGALQAQLHLLEVAATTQKPDFADPHFATLLAPINAEVLKLGTLKDANRKSEYYNHLNTVAEGAPVVGWCVSDTPVLFVPEFKDSAQFWANRVIKDYKEKDARHVQWARDFAAVFDALRQYVKEYHPKGLAWNASGKPLGAAASPSASPSASASGAPPPPPPPPPADLYELTSASLTSASLASTSAPLAPAGGISAVFADLNKGENVTAGLKKVDRLQMTHKNPSLRAPAPPKKPLSLSAAPPKKPLSLSATPPKPAKTELVDGTKWVIENHTASEQPIVVDVEMSQSVFIGNCQGVTVQLRGKANAVSVSETKNCAIVVDSLVLGIDVIKLFKFGLQVTGVVYMVSVDKSDEGSIYLSRELAEKVQVFTSSTTSLNVNVPEDEDYKELAIPEQFKHTFAGGKLVSEVVEHAG